MYHHWEYAAEETVSERHSPVIRLSAEVMMSKISKSGAQGVFAQALTALGNYQDEKAKNPPASGPPGRNYAPSQQEQENAKAGSCGSEVYKRWYGKRQLELKVIQAQFLAVVIWLVVWQAWLNLQQVCKEIHDVYAFWWCKSCLALLLELVVMSVSLGAQFNMRMKTPNLARMRGSANALSMVPKSKRMASKLKSMFSGGGGGMSFGGSKWVVVGRRRRSVEGGASGDGADDDR